MKSYVLAALLASANASTGAVGEACDTVTTPDNGGCDAATAKCAIAPSPAASVNTCVATATCGTLVGAETMTCYESPVAPPVTSEDPYVPCSNDHTKRENVILEAMTNHHNTALLKKTTPV
jgi:hypothetical protein